MTTNNIFQQDMRRMNVCRENGVKKMSTDMKGLAMRFALRAMIGGMISEDWAVVVI